MESLIVGVDAGGTKTVAMVAKLRSASNISVGVAGAAGPSSASEQSVAQLVEVLGTGTAGPGNLRAVGVAAATDNILRAIKSAYASAEIGSERATSLCMGVAGAGRAEEQAQLHAWCKQLGIAEHVTIHGDATLVLAASLGDLPAIQLPSLCRDSISGVALISGTGSMAWGCNGIDRQARCGGWGFLLGDEGSGYWIALNALQFVCRSVDGRAVKTSLLPALLDRLGIAEPSQIVARIYGERLSRDEIAALAPTVLQHAAHDEVAASIVERAADSLAELVLSVARQLELEAPLPLAYAGGILCNSLALQLNLDKRLAFLKPSVSIISSPVVGAVYLAAAQSADATL